jgi:hypothetical protein
VINDDNILASNPRGLKRRIPKVEHEMKHMVNIYLFVLLDLGLVFFVLGGVFCPNFCALGIICHCRFLG